MLIQRIPNEIKKLEEMMDETLYVDIGFGMEENAQGDVVGSSAFNTAVPGLNIVAVRGRLPTA